MAQLEHHFGEGLLKEQPYAMPVGYIKKLAMLLDPQISNVHQPLPLSVILEINGNLLLQAGLFHFLLLAQPMFLQIKLPQEHVLVVDVAMVLEVPKGVADAQLSTTESQKPPILLLVKIDNQHKHHSHKMINQQMPHLRLMSLPSNYKHKTPRSL